MSIDRMIGQQTAYEHTKNFCTKLREDIVKQGYKGHSVQSVKSKWAHINTWAQEIL